MKIAVYTPALNEERFAERWAKSASDADQLLVLDTGSKDQTVSALRDFKVDIGHASIRPWRFDDAKNVALFSLDDDVDVAIQLDMDEVLTPGWRAKIETDWRAGTTRLHYKIITSWTADGQPDCMFFADRISGRFSHRWRGPVHETLTPTIPEVISVCDHVLVEHHPDNDKSRHSYLNLLRQAVEEEPLNDRYAHYYARELYYNGKHQDAVAQFQRHLQLPTARWVAERAASLRYSGMCHESLGNAAMAHNCHLLATLEDPGSREALVDLASFLLRQQDWTGVVYFCGKAMQIKADTLTYISGRYAREEGPFDLAAVAMYNLGQRTTALGLAQQALALSPNDARLQANVKMMEDEHGT